MVIAAVIKNLAVSSLRAVSVT